MNRKFAIAVFVMALLLSALACKAVPINGSQPGSVPTIAPAATLSTDASQGQASLMEEERALMELFQRVSPGVVEIFVYTAQGGGQGSGFVYDTAGHIITNFHVVDGATQIEVDFPSGYKTYGTVVGVDPDSDIGVIKVDAPASELHPLPMGDSDLLKVGQAVVAIGNPFGLDSTMTRGIISGLGRTEASQRTAPGGGNFSVGGIIQTDAAINPGNSGGPLLNLSGEVVGINNMLQSQTSNAQGDLVNSGIGFAVPVNIVKRVVPVVIRDGKYDYPFLGITSFGDGLDLESAKLLGLSEYNGVYVTSVVPGGPADKAGIKAGDKETSVQGLMAGGDLIVAIDGKPLRSYAEFITYLVTEKSPGDEVVVTVLRGTEKMDITITLGKRPSQ